MNASSPLASRPAYFLYGAIVIVAAVIVGATFVSPLLSAKREFATYNVDTDNVAIHGYDTVAYFTEGKPMKGKNEFVQVWEDARWQFASATNLELFKANPERYAPQFGPPNRSRHSPTDSQRRRGPVSTTSFSSAKSSTTRGSWSPNWTESSHRSRRIEPSWSSTATTRSWPVRSTSEP